MNFRGPRKFKIFTPPLSFGDLTPPYPGLQLSEEKHARWKTPSHLGDGPDTVLESTVSNAELRELFCPFRVLGRELSEFLSSYFLVCQNELTEFFTELTKFAADLSEFSLAKQYPRNSIPPFSFAFNISP